MLLPQQPSQASLKAKRYLAALNEAFWEAVLKSFIQSLALALSPVPS
jgi:hypothetical protein